MDDYVNFVNARGYDLGSNVTDIAHDVLAKLDTMLNRDLLSMAIDCAESIVAHGCLDGVFLLADIIKPNGDNNNNNDDNHNNNHINNIHDASDQTQSNVHVIDITETVFDTSDHEPIFNTTLSHTHNEAYSTSINTIANTSIKAVNTISELLFLCNISSEKVELAALKYLLTTRCRTASSSFS